MRIIYILIFLVFLTSCKGLTNMERNNIIYTVKSLEAEEIISEKIKFLKKRYKTVYVELQHVEGGYYLWLSPINNERKKIVQNLKLRKTGRVLNVYDNNYYYLIFHTDESLGGFLKSAKQKKENLMSSSVSINDHSIRLKFDEKWNLID